MNFISKMGTLSEKDKDILRNLVGAIVIKGGALSISLFTMPAYMRFFADQQVLGVWFTILSMLTWILNFDLGIGNGLRNKLAAALAIDERKEAHEYISSAYLMIGIVMLLLLIVGNLIIPSIRWNGVFNVSEQVISSSVMRETVRFVFFGIMLQFFFRTISSILYAMQFSALNSFLSLLISILQLTFVLIAPSYSPERNLKMLSFAYILTSNLPLILITGWVFLKPLKGCIPSISSFRMDKAKAVITLGSIFFFCQILYMIIANTNEFFIAQYTDPSNVVEYQIYFRLFSLSSMVMMLALTPVWSAVTKAAAEKDYVWMNKIYGKLKAMSLLGIVAEFLLIVILQWLVNVWLGEKSIKVNYFYAVSFASFGSAMLYQATLSTIVCGIGRMKLQAISYGVGVIMKFIIIHFGVAITGSWIMVVLANVVILIPYCVLQQKDLTKYINKHIIPQEG